MKLRRKPRIAVVCGGPSIEAEVSRSTGSGVAKALRSTYANVTLLELNRGIVQSLQRCRAEVVFPALHGPPGEDGCFQGLLEILRLPYVGSGVLASAWAMDKIASKQAFRAYQLPVAPDIAVCRDKGIAVAVRRILHCIGSTVVIKPSRQGSGLGVGFTNGSSALRRALIKAFSLGEMALVEKRIHGREITCGVLERNGVEALPVLEVRTPPGTWYDYKHRYTPGYSRHLIPAPLPSAQYLRIQEIAVRAHKALGCRDLSRVDFVVPDRGSPILLEVNTLPGMTPTSLYPDEAKAAGISFEMLVAHFIERAIARSR